jgi:hypothetical protein
VSLAQCDGLCSLKETARPLRELFHVHRHSPFLKHPSGSAHISGTPPRALPHNWGARPAPSRAQGRNGQGFCLRPTPPLISRT